MSAAAIRHLSHDRAFAGLIRRVGPPRLEQEIDRSSSPYEALMRAIAGLTYPLVAPGYKPDAAAGVITDGLTPKDVKKPYLRSFPYLGVPYGGYYNPS